MVQEVLPLGGDGEKSQNSAFLPAQPSARGVVRARENAEAWALEPHVCRHCFGRLVSRAAVRGGRLFACTNCGESALGEAPDVLCSCGVTLRRHGVETTQVPAGLKCRPNPNRTPAFPSLFVAAEGET
jgi:ribosomal protein L37AE/L43A